jgi:hypothetical protein
MEISEYAALHRPDEMAREAIHDRVHDAACACHHTHDPLHQRTEMQLCQLSWEVTRAAQEGRQTQANP